MANDVFDVVRTVMAVREYDGRQVPDDALRRVVEAAHLTASASNRQPWHFVLVRDRASLDRLGTLVKTGPYIRTSSAAVIAACEKGNRIAESDVSRAIQSMILTAWGEGIGSNWTGFAGLDAVGREFALPDTYEVLGVIPLGYPKRRIIGKKKRKPLGEVVSAERFGTPLA